VPLAALGMYYRAWTTRMPGDVQPGIPGGLPGDVQVLRENLNVPWHRVGRLAFEAARPVQVGARRRRPLQEGPGLRGLVGEVDGDQLHPFAAVLVEQQLQLGEVGDALAVPAGPEVDGDVAGQLLDVELGVRGRPGSGRRRLCQLC
jgi:hypothetical protein